MSAIHELRAVLAERFPDAVQRAPAGGVLPTGLGELDARLPGGGLPRGCLVELEGGLSSGKDCLVDRMAAGVTISSGQVGYIDLPGRFYPPAMAAAGARLERVLVARPGALPQALWACELLARCQGFALIVLDLTVQPAPQLAAAPLHRLARVAELGPAVVLLLTDPGPGAASRPEPGRAEPGSALSARPVWGRARVLPESVTALRLLAERSRSGPVVRVTRSRHALPPHR